MGVRCDVLLKPCLVDVTPLLFGLRSEDFEPDNLTQTLDQLNNFIKDSFYNYNSSTYSTMKYPTLILSLIVAIAHASTCPFKAGNEYVTRSRRPGIKEIISQRFQIRTSCKPNGFLAKRIQPVLSLLEGFTANAPHYLSWKRMAFGENFMAAGEVVLGEFDEVSEAMTNPQARTFRLGTGILDSRHLPGKLKGGPKRNLWVSKSVLVVGRWFASEE